MQDKRANRTALVVVYNHNYESNIPRIRRLYSSRFAALRQLMPFYYGDEPDVIPVHGSSFQFHSFIAQARHRLMEIECDRFLIIGDDLLLTPEIDESNVEAVLHLKKADCYLDGFIDIASGENARATFEAHRFSTTHRGLQRSVESLVPSASEAFRTLSDLGRISSTTLRRYRPFLPNWIHPVRSNVYRNWKVLKGRIYNLLIMLKYRLRPRRAAYPCVFGYSDILSVPKARFVEFCRYLEVFASWRMFVEHAIPTALSLMPDNYVVTIERTGLKTGNVWFPPTPDHHEAMKRTIERLVQTADKDVDALARNYPREFLYLHPVKLSQFC